MQLTYSDHITKPREMHSDGLSPTDYTTSSNQLIREFFQGQVRRYSLVQKQLDYHLLDRTPGTPDSFVPDIGGTSNSTTTAFIDVDDQPVDLSWLFAALNSGELEQPSVANLTSCIQGINELIARGKFDLLSKVIGSANLDGMSNETMLAFARSSFPVRERISNWKRFARAVQAELDKRGKDGVQLMRGLV